MEHSATSSGRRRLPPSPVADGVRRGVRRCWPGPGRNLLGLTYLGHRHNRRHMLGHDSSTRDRSQGRPHSSFPWSGRTARDINQASSPHTQAPYGLPSPLIPSPLVHGSGQGSDDSRQRPQFGAPATDRDVTDPQSVRTLWRVWAMSLTGEQFGEVNARRHTELAWGGGRGPRWSSRGRDRGAAAGAAVRGPTASWHIVKQVGGGVFSGYAVMRGQEDEAAGRSAGSPGQTAWPWSGSTWRRLRVPGRAASRSSSGPEATSTTDVWVYREQDELLGAALERSRVDRGEDLRPAGRRGGGAVRRGCVGLWPAAVRVRSRAGRLALQRAHLVPAGVRRGSGGRQRPVGPRRLGLREDRRRALERAHLVADLGGPAAACQVPAERPGGGGHRRAVAVQRLRPRQRQCGRRRRPAGDPALRRAHFR